MLEEILQRLNEAVQSVRSAIENGIPHGDESQQAGEQTHPEPPANQVPVAEPGQSVVTPDDGQEKLPRDADAEMETDIEVSCDEVEREETAIPSDAEFGDNFSDESEHETPGLQSSEDGNLPAGRMKQHAEPARETPAPDRPVFASAPAAFGRRKFVDEWDDALYQGDGYALHTVRWDAEFMWQVFYDDDPADYIYNESRRPWVDGFNVNTLPREDTPEMIQASLRS